ncbi:hypothetical protein JO972_01110 [Verrucomicrobiaceae bacterium 5K15]|uniref:Uncharacterized protein n=1 Tax=Oceaniferula flava TaxID=2800421 RepID=A0AAE2SAT6_9BACT|nr:hypothetical protein [Oceaniferula flavus]MBK1853547.1 hypothetical protein [Oceaniferula flavus]MBM1134852.1 hypothetical protein [Oceaniferula flavus]
MSESNPRIYKVILMILPVGVVIGTIIFMYMYFHNERRDEQNHAVIASHGLRVDDLQDMVGKFSNRIGVRAVDSEEGRRGLVAAASMIEGRLGPQNVGFPVKKSEGQASHGRLWKALWVDIRGSEDPESIIFAAVSFSGAGEMADANTVSSMVMLASTMAREVPERTIRFVFLPLDLSPSEQNRWLLERCLNDGERCDGIVGLKEMQGELAVGDGAWQAEAGSDSQWWQYLQDQSSRPETEAPAVWLSHPVFSPDTWKGQDDKRLQKTIEAAGSMKEWLKRAAK